MRRELATLLWGGGFFLLGLYAWVGVVWGLHQLRRQVRRQPVFKLDLKRELVEQEAAVLRVEAQVPPRLPPGFRAWFETVWTAGLHRRLQLGASLVPGQNKLELDFQAARGLYRGRPASLFLADFFGLTHGRVDLPGEETLTVWPAAGEAPPVLPPTSGEGDILQTRRRQRNDELLESRKYYPGDDVRRINWKMYAHLDELFLRIGEENPPPEARFTLAFDPSDSPHAAPALHAELLDRRIRSFLALIDDLDRRGHPVEILLPGEPHPLGGETGRRSLLLTALAGLTAGELPLPWPQPGEKQAQRPMIFTVPDSPALPALLAPWKPAGISPVIVPAPWPLDWAEPPRPPKTPWWKVPDQQARQTWNQWQSTKDNWNKAWFAAAGGRHGA